MSNKKHIDRLFQEKFKDFEAKPNPNVWNAIQDQLDSPQNAARIIPFWIKAAGVAALLLLFFGLGTTLLNDDNTLLDKSPVVEIDQESNSDSNTSTTQDASENQVSSNNSNTSTELQDNKRNPENGLTEQEQVQNNYNTSPDSKQPSLTVKTSDAPLERSNSAAHNESNSIVNTSKNTPRTTLDQNMAQDKMSQSNQPQENNQITAHNNKDKGATNTAKLGPSNASNRDPSEGNSTENSLANPEQLSDKVVQRPLEQNMKQNVINDINNTDNNNNINNTDAALALAQSLNEKEEEKSTIVKDSIGSNAIDEAIAETEDLVEKEKLLNRWTLNANVAPVYYNTLGKGSHIHDQFVENPKNGEINTSYGISVGYALNDRLKVRSGLNKLNLSYDTANVIVFQTVANTPGSNPLRNIDFKPTIQGQSISVLSADNLGVQQINGIVNDQLNAALSQRISYVEIPVELEYTMINKRFGLHLIGGLSTFILNDNEVVTEVENRKTVIGKANNINSLSFSTNLGLGLDYKFTDTFKFNLEPTFKYQINAYSEISGDFKPYIIGVYTGFTYKF